MTDILIIVITFVMVMIWFAKFQGLQEKYSEWLERSFGNYAWFTVAKYLPVMMLFQWIDLYDRAITVFNMF